MSFPRIFPGLLGLLAVGLGVARAAEVSPETVMLAVRALQASDLSGWTFETVETSPKQTRVLHHGPGRPGERPVRLVSIDNRPPTSEEGTAFADEQASEREARAKAEAEKDGEESSGAMELEGMITPGSLQFVGQEGDLARFAFVPQIALDGPAEAQEALVGTLLYDTRREFLVGLEVRNDGVFRPKFGSRSRSCGFTFASTGSSTERWRHSRSRRW